MIVYIGDSNTNGTKYRGMESVEYRFMFTPFSYRRNYKGKYALDNGAFSAFANGRCFDDGAFLKAFFFMSQHADFVIVPDKVAAGKKSFDYSMTWRDFLPNRIRYYLAVQDGMTTAILGPDFDVKFSGIFVGGSMEWKQKTAEQWVEFAHARGKDCHIGRVGTYPLLMWAERIGADSVDSSNFAQNEKNRIELVQFSKGIQKSLEVIE